MRKTLWTLVAVAALGIGCKDPKDSTVKYVFEGSVGTEQVKYHYSIPNADTLIVVDSSGKETKYSLFQDDTPLRICVRERPDVAEVCLDQRDGDNYNPAVVNEARQKVKQYRAAILKAKENDPWKKWHNPNID